ncbi:tyrosine-protein phosphatase [Halobacillus hunanensis]|uniref:tyrosine-protein phosphatase n=1 Tax=Halobacillus hunanensis TaxID=578214 RepID=UPI0009A62DB1|nr:CpsB/CapC family capsule biosynthesis tyrosine phosphatase [Halobacillus hunanensis]
MIDIHTHILPGVDEGPSTMEHSIKMAEKAVKDGIETVVAAPHYNNGGHVNDKNTILIQVRELNRELEERDIPLTVLPGQETRAYADLVEALRNDEILTVNEGDYVLIDLPHDHVPGYLNTLLFNMQVEGYQPIIVHSERNEQIIEQPNLLYSLVKNGAFVQITAGSLLGKHGSKVKKLSHQLIDANLVHLVASGAQKPQELNLKDGYREIKKHYDQSMVYYFSENAQYVVEGQALATAPPQRVKKKKVLGIF